MDILKVFSNEIEIYFENFIGILPRLCFAIVVCLVIAFIFRLLRIKLMKYLKINAEDILLVNFSNSIFKILNIIVIVLVFLYMMGLGNVAGSILGAAGISAFVIGFAMKDIGENFLAGIIMAFHRPFRLGDTIKTNDVVGNIVEMSLRETHIKTFDGKDVYVPNGQIIKNPLYNYTIDGYLRGEFEVGIGYEMDVEVAKKIIIDTLNGIPGILKDEKKSRTHVKSLGTNAISIEVHYWIDTFNENYSALEVKSLAQSRVVASLNKANIKMPNNIVEVKNKDK